MTEPLHMTQAASGGIGYRPWPHRWAVLITWTTFPLIWVGGLVTTYDAGMAVPDWPGTFGYNLFLYPWQTWLFGPWDLFLEHKHRLLASLVGFLTIAFVVVVYRQDQRPGMRHLAVWALVAVIAQGLLGGARVLLVERQLAMLHGSTGPAFFAYCVVLCAVTSRWWHEAPVMSSESAGGLHGWILAVVLVSYFQLVLGALLRHVPESASTWYFEVTVWAHLIGAGTLLILAMAAAWRVFRAAAALPVRGGSFHWLTGLLLILVFAQLVLGCATWVMKYHWPTFVVHTPLTTIYTLIEAHGMLQSIIATAHAANGSLLLGVGVLLAARALRLVRKSPEVGKSATRVAPTG
jgi:heme a synthase